MYEALRGLYDFSDLYLDNILVFSKSIPEHLEHIYTVLQYLYDKKAADQAHQMRFPAQLFVIFGSYCVRQGVCTQPSKG